MMSTNTTPRRTPTTPAIVNPYLKKRKRQQQEDDEFEHLPWPSDEVLCEILDQAEKATTILPNSPVQVTTSKNPVQVTQQTVSSQATSSNTSMSDNESSLKKKINSASNGTASMEWEKEANSDNLVVLEDSDDDDSDNDDDGNLPNVTPSLTQMVQEDAPQLRPTQEQKRVMNSMSQLRVNLEQFVQQECRQLGKPYGGRLCRGIGQLQASGQFAADFVGVLHTLREYGNAAVHSQLSQLPSYEVCAEAVQTYLKYKEQHKLLRRRNNYR